MDKNNEPSQRPTLTQRWEDGIPHDPRSVELYKHIEKLDFDECNDSLCLKSGGDGDNGEHLMYLMDDYFYTIDQKRKDFVDGIINDNAKKENESDVIAGIIIVFAIIIWSYMMLT